MQYILDKYNRWQNGNSGHVESFWFELDGVQTTCRAHVREDGKVLSKMDCWQGLEHTPKDQRKILQNPDGPYLITPGKRFELN
jgi:hypothetical protein